MSWTQTDRVIAALSGEVPDRTPIFDYLIHDGVFEHYLGRPIVPGEREAILQASAKCLDLCHPMPVAYEPHEETLPDGTRRVFERWMTWNVYPQRTEEEMIRSVKNDIDQLETGTHWLCGEYGGDWLEEDKRRQSWAGDMVYINLGLSVSFLPGRNFEEEGFFLSECPGLCKRWNQLHARHNLTMTQARADCGFAPVAIIWNDIAMKGGLIYSPSVLEEYLFPGLAEMVGILHSKGIKAIFHSDGDVGPVMDKLIECGIDGFNPLEISAGMEVLPFIEQYGDKVTLVGGLDAVDVLAYGTPEAVVRATRQIINASKKSGRLILGSSSGQIDNSMPLENVTAYFNSVIY